MIKIFEDTDIVSLLEQGYYIVCSDTEDFCEDDCCDEYWYLTDAKGAPSGKSLYNWSFIYDPEGYSGWDKWYQDFEEWKHSPNAFIRNAKFACSKEELIIKQFYVNKHIFL